MSPLRPLRFSVSFALLVFKISGKAASQRTAKDTKKKLNNEYILQLKKVSIINHSLPSQSL